MWAHFYDPHHPHVAEEGYEHLFEDIYDAEIAYMDDQIQRLADAIEAHGSNDIIWVLVSDHGEAFNYEHGESTHGMFLYDETVNVPFIIQPSPRLPGTKNIDHPVSIVDIPNTLLSLLDLPPMIDTDGRDVLQLSERPPVYIESKVVQQRFGYHPEIAIVEDNQKLMATPNPHLYHLQDDPTESTNRYQPSESHQKLMSFGHTLFSSAPNFQTDSPDASVYKHLEALGYMGGDTESRPLESYAIDAKDRIATIRELEDILKMRANHTAVQPEEIIQRFQILQRFPNP